jgi:hypothetical protein
VLPSFAAEALHLVSYALAVAFLVVNRRITGLWLVALGGALNLLAISANHGVMPASNAALARAGRQVVSERFSNSNAVPHARLAFLGDVFAVPKRFPLANVFSVGDVLLVVGIGVILHAATHQRVWSKTPGKARVFDQTLGSEEPQAGGGDAGLGLGELDDELGAVGREDVLAHKDGAALEVACDAPAAQHGRARGDAE